MTYSLSSESEDTKNLSDFDISIFQRVWDAADFVVPPSENNAFFVLTNAIITPNQIRDTCPEDTNIPDIICGKHGSLNLLDRNVTKHKLKSCKKGQIRSFKSHGAETGRCVNQNKRSDKDAKDQVQVCEISGWCPVEHNTLLMDNEPLLPNTENFTVYIKNTISFPWFDGSKYKRNNMPNGICVFSPIDQTTRHCPIFRLGDIIAMAKGRKFDKHT